MPTIILPTTEMYTKPIIRTWHVKEDHDVARDSKKETNKSQHFWLMLGREEKRARQNLIVPLPKLQLALPLITC